MRAMTCPYWAMLDAGRLADEDNLLHSDRMSLLQLQLELVSDPSCIVGEKAPAQSKLPAAPERSGA